MKWAFTTHIWYRSEKWALEGNPPCMSFNTDTIPAHCSCERICPPMKWWDFMLMFGLRQRMKLAPVAFSLVIRSFSWVWGASRRADG